MYRYFFITFFSFSFLIAQEISITPTPVFDDPRIETIDKLIPSLRADEAELKQEREKLKKATTEEQKKEISANIERLRNNVLAINKNIRRAVTGISEKENVVGDNKPLSIQDEIGSLFQPILRELRQASSQPREIENLSREIPEWEEKIHRNKAAIIITKELLAKKSSPDVVKELNDLKESFNKKLIESEGSLSMKKLQLAQLKSDAPSIFTLLTVSFAGFWKNRGLSLILALLGGLLVWYGCRRIYKFLIGYSPFHKKFKNSFSVRLFDIIAGVVAIFISLLTVIIVLYVRNDWLLLTGAVILLIGLAWASRTALPPYFEQIRLILNLGTVRLGERVVIDGLPWRVDALNFICTLRNPNLNGGILRIPAKILQTKSSRPHEENESWFPTKKDEWVLLDDGTSGKVILQSPEQVILVKMGGSNKIYSTSTFLSKNPENLSRQFRVRTLLMVDIKNRNIASTDIPRLLQEKIFASAIEIHGKEKVKSVHVEFTSLNASHLNYQIALDADGSMASKLNSLERMMQKCALEVLNENQW
jgi:small-conductance mechanosensitive channel